MRSRSVRRKANSRDMVIVVILRCPRNARASKDGQQGRPSRLAQWCKCTTRLAPPAMSALRSREGDGAATWMRSPSHPLHRHRNLRAVLDGLVNHAVALGEFQQQIELV